MNDKQLDRIVRQVYATLAPPPQRDWLPDRAVLMTIAIGVCAILGGVVIGIFTSKATIPNWAENVLVAVVTGGLLKIGDVVTAIVSLAAGRQTERLGNRLADSAPAGAANGKPDNLVHTVEEGQ
jgi:hypothetical protein